MAAGLRHDPAFLKKSKQDLEAVALAAKYVIPFAPGIGTETLILPLLNGMRHLDVLDSRFGRARTRKVTFRPASRSRPPKYPPAPTTRIHMLCLPMVLKR